MPDEKGKNPESAETQDDSPTNKKTPADDSDKADSKVVKKPKSEAEKEWEGLRGSTQDRVVELVRRAKEAETALERTKFQTPSNLTPSDTPTPPKAPSQDEVKEAVKQLIKPLKDEGVVTKEELNALQNRWYLDFEHNRLTTKFNGSDGRPKYLSEEVEDYARTHGYGGNLEAAYEQLYKDELLDFEIKHRGYQKRKEPYTEKPVASVKIGEKVLTRETLRERLRQPDGPDWWAKHKDKIDLAKLSPR